VKRVTVGMLLATMVAGTALAGPAGAATARQDRPRYHELRCDVSARQPRVITSPRRVQGRASVTSFNSGSEIHKVVIWTFLQWFDGDRWKRIAIYKRSWFNVNSGTTFRTSVTKECGGAEHFIFRTKVTGWVFDDNGDLRLKRRDTAPAASGTTLPCSGAAGF
jgi:hypothetical protein